MTKLVIPARANSGLSAQTGDITLSHNRIYVVYTGQSKRNAVLVNAPGPQMALVATRLETQRHDTTSMIARPFDVEANCSRLLRGAFLGMPAYRALLVPEICQKGAIRVQKYSMTDPALIGFLCGEAPALSKGLNADFMAEKTVTRPDGVTVYVAAPAAKLQ